MRGVDDAVVSGGNVDDEGGVIDDNDDGRDDRDGVRSGAEEDSDGLGVGGDGEVDGVDLRDGGGVGGGDEHMVDNLKTRNEMQHSGIFISKDTQYTVQYLRSLRDEGRSQEHQASKEEGSSLGWQARRYGRDLLTRRGG